MLAPRNAGALLANFLRSALRVAPVPPLALLTGAARGGRAEGVGTRNVTQNIDRASGGSNKEQGRGSVINQCCPRISEPLY